MKCPRFFRIYNGQAILGTVGVSGDSRDALAEAERIANNLYGLWDRIEEV